VLFDGGAIPVTLGSWTEAQSAMEGDGGAEKKPVPIRAETMNNARFANLGP